MTEIEDEKVEGGTILQKWIYARKRPALVAVSNKETKKTPI